MEPRSYNQFCPVALTAEVLCSRWTMLVVRELVAGRRRFNEIRRGLAGMSPGLLAKRLRELEDAGIAERRLGPDGLSHEYHLTPAGRDLGPIIEAFGVWGERWMRASPSLRDPSPGALLWDMRRVLLTQPPGPGRWVVQISYRNGPPMRRDWWIVADDTGVDVCCVDPGVGPDLYVSADLRVLMAVWMGVASLDVELARGGVVLTGDAARRQGWIDWLREAVPSPVPSPGPPLRLVHPLPEAGRRGAGRRPAHP